MLSRTTECTWMHCICSGYREIHNGTSDYFVSPKVWTLSRRSSVRNTSRAADENGYTVQFTKALRAHANHRVDNDISAIQCIVLVRCTYTECGEIPSPANDKPKRTRRRRRRNRAFYRRSGLGRGWSRDKSCNNVCIAMSSHNVISIWP
jgi:hypothetical protein